MRFIKKILKSISNYFVTTAKTSWLETSDEYRKQQKRANSKDLVVKNKNNKLRNKELESLQTPKINETTSSLKLENLQTPKISETTSSLELENLQTPKISETTNTSKTDFNTLRPKLQLNDAKDQLTPKMKQNGNSKAFSLIDPTQNQTSEVNKVSFLKNRFVSTTVVVFLLCSLFQKKAIDTTKKLFFKKKK